jgi:hypothetical protein
MKSKTTHAPQADIHASRKERRKATSNLRAMAPITLHLKHSKNREFPAAP